MDSSPTQSASMCQSRCWLKAGGAHPCRTIRALPWTWQSRSSHQVRPYVRRNKTDRTDAKGILEASRNDDIHPVPVKTVAQQVLTSLHRLRSGWMAERTARLNTLSSLLRELGVFIPVGSRSRSPRRPRSPGHGHTTRTTRRYLLTGRVQVPLVGRPRDSTSRPLGLSFFANREHQPVRISVLRDPRAEHFFRLLNARHA